MGGKVTEQLSVTRPADVRMCVSTGPALGCLTANLGPFTVLVLPFLSQVPACTGKQQRSTVPTPAFEGPTLRSCPVVATMMSLLSCVGEFMLLAIRAEKLQVFAASFLVTPFPGCVILAVFCSPHLCVLWFSLLRAPSGRLGVRDASLLGASGKVATHSSF